MAKIHRFYFEQLTPPFYIAKQKGKYSKAVIFFLKTVESASENCPFMSASLTEDSLRRYTAKGSLTQLSLLKCFAVACLLPLFK